MNYEVTIEQDAQSFWDTNAEALVAHESEYNLVIGTTLGILSSERMWGDLNFFTVRRGGELVGQAMHTGGDKPLVCTHLGPRAIEALVDAAIVHEFAPERVSGPAETAELCAQAFAKHRGTHVKLIQRQGIYELREVLWPPSEGGRLICGTSDHGVIALDWLTGFIRECFPDEAEPGRQAEEIVTRRLDAGHLYFWQTAEGELVSMAGRNRESPNTTTLSLVYTPTEKRGRGYASLVVAHLSQIWLDRGKRATNLFTDLANPASNKAYVRVGYRQLVESRIYSIEPT